MKRMILVILTLLCPCLGYTQGPSYGNFIGTFTEASTGLPVLGQAATNSFVASATGKGTNISLSTATNLDYFYGPYSQYLYFPGNNAFTLTDSANLTAADTVVGSGGTLTLGDQAGDTLTMQAGSLQFSGALTADSYANLPLATYANDGPPGIANFDGTTIVMLGYDSNGLPYFGVNGANLAGLHASAIASGTLATNRLPGTLADVSKVPTNILVTQTTLVAVSNTLFNLYTTGQAQNQIGISDDTSMGFTTNGGTFVIFTNSHPCTVTFLHLSDSATADTSCMLNTVITFCFDGLTNQCLRGSLFNGWGNPAPFYTDKLSYSWYGVGPQAVTCDRKVSINSYTNGGWITLTMPPNVGGGEINDDVTFQIGTPTAAGVNRVWHCVDSAFYTGYNQYAQALNVTGNSGILEFVGFCAGSTNNSIGTALPYLQSRPWFIWDSTNFPMGNATEDAFGGGYQLGASVGTGPDVYANNTYGGQLDSWLNYTYWTPYVAPATPFLIGNNFYRWFDSYNFIWTNNVQLNWTNIAPGYGSVSNRWFVSYHTAN